MKDSVISAIGLQQSRGQGFTLGPWDLGLAVGEKLAILGENGVGKTTLLRILATLDTPAAGQLQLWGVKPEGSERAKLRRRLGYLGHQSGLTLHLTALENLEFFARLQGLELGAPQKALARVGLEKVADRQVGELSRGMQQRLTLARAIMHDPKLLILDEPDASLDTAGEELLSEIVLGRSVVLATHSREVAVRLADRHLQLGST